MAIDFPNSPATNDTFSSAGKTWFYSGTTWKLRAVASVPDGGIGTSQLANASVTAPKIANSVVAANHIANATITATQIANATITATQIASDAVTTANILDSNVTAAKLASNAAVTNIGYTPANLASPTFTGTVTIPAGASISGFATLASPTFTGSVTGSPAVGTTSTGTSGFGYMGLPQNSATTGAYGVVAADAGLHIYSSATRTITIPANGTIAMPIGSTIAFVAGTGATVTIAITSDTMYLAGTGTTGSRTLAAFGMATAVKITSTSWIISGNGLTQCLAYQVGQLEV